MVFEDFCANTSLHGWRFVPITKNPMGRTLWAIIAVSSIGVASLFIHTAVRDFFSATGKTKIIYPVIGFDFRYSIVGIFVRLWHFVDHKCTVDTTRIKPFSTCIY